MARTRGAGPKSAEEPTAKRVKTDESKIGPGDPIPQVTLQDQDGKEVDVGSIKGLLVLFAYPKAKTPGCTRQTRGFGEKFPEFEKLGAAVYGVSADSPTLQESFKKSLSLPFSLLSDPQYKLLGPLGAQKKPKGVMRSHWVFKDGLCLFAENQVKPDASPETTYSAVEEANAANSVGEGAGESLREAAEERAVKEGSDYGEGSEYDGVPKNEANGHEQPENTVDESADAPKAEFTPQTAADSEVEPAKPEAEPLAETEAHSATDPTEAPHSAESAAVNGGAPQNASSPIVQEPREAEEPTPQEQSRPDASTAEPEAKALSAEPLVEEPKD